MRGRYYARHAIYHSIDNQHRINKLNENYKSITKRQAISYLKIPELCLKEKVVYLNSLTQDNYRYGRKYKYKCNLNSSEISQIIRIVNDNELHKAYFGKTISEFDKSNAIFLGVFVGVILFVCSYLLFLESIVGVESSILSPTSS